MSIQRRRTSAGNDSPAPTEPTSAERSALRSYLWAHAITVAGNWAQIVVILILAKSLGANGFLIGLIGACRQLPQLVLGPLIGSLLDRWDLRRTVVLVEASSGVLVGIVALLAAVDAIGLGALAAFAIVLGLLNVVDNPARLALVGSIVGSESMAKAMAYATTASAAARVAGPGIAAFGLLLADPWAVFAADAVSFLIGAALFARVVVRDSPNDAPTEEEAGLLSTRRLLADRTMRSILALVLAATVCALNIQVVLILFVTETLGRSEQAFSVVLAVIGVSGMIGALAARRVAAPTVRLVSAAAVVLGASLGLAGLTRSIVLAAALFALGAIGGGMFIATSMTLMQLAAPTGGRGRTMALHSAVYNGTAPFAGPIGGVISDAFSPSVAVIVLGVVLLAVALAVGVSTSATTDVSDGRERRRR